MKHIFNKLLYDTEKSNLFYTEKIDIPYIDFDLKIDTYYYKTKGGRFFNIIIEHTTYKNMSPPTTHEYFRFTNVDELIYTLQNNNKWDIIESVFEIEEA